MLLSRRKLLAIGALLALALCCGLLIFSVTKPVGNSRVTSDNYEKLRPGATSQEVRTVLGEPDSRLDIPAGGADRTKWTFEDTEHDVPSQPGNKETNFIVVFFDEKEIVSGVSFGGSVGPPNRLSDRLINWMKNKLNL